MKTYLLTAVVMAAFSCTTAIGQPANSASPIDSLAQFNQKQWTNFYWSQHSSPSGLAEFLNAHQRDYIRETFFPTQRSSAQNPVPQQACTNIDFENGDLTGWQRSSGYNPGYNALGCCQSAGGAQTIMTGAGTDPCAGFPVVAPGGNFSLRLGNNGSGGIADRIEQTFMVTPANANFTYKYAVVLQDPGHATSDQPSFQIDMVDSTNTPIPCTFYNVAAGQNIPGFINSTTCNNVVYKPWSSVSVDLTNYIGQNVTIRFTTYDCALGGHYGYAYIDGSCLDFNITQDANLCQGNTIQLTAPIGFATYNWTLPNGASATGQVLTTGIPGVYTVTLTTITGCPGPTLTYSLTQYPKPTASFLPIQATACTHSLTFVNTSTVSSGSIVMSNWNMGDGNTSNNLNGFNNYTNDGTYNVQLISTSNMGCRDTVTIPITILPLPVVTFTANAVCLHNSTSFLNTTTVNNGFVTNSVWQFGDGSSSSLAQPTHTYANAGSFPVTLIVTTNSNCVNSTTQNVIVHPLPIANFTSNEPCLNQATQFNNLSTIATGSIIKYRWDFENDGIIDDSTANPSHLYPSAGTQQSRLQAISNNNCSNQNLGNVIVHYNPTANFQVPSTCIPNATTFNNLSTSSDGVITSYAWDFNGDNVTDNVQQNPQYIFTSSGNFGVRLEVQTQYGCVNTIIKSAFVNPSPTSSFVAQNNEGCPSLCVNFINQSNISSGQIVTNQWIFGDGSNPDYSLNPIHCYQTGNYSVTLKTVSDSGCINETTLPNLVNVYPNPTANFYITPDKVDITQPLIQVEDASIGATSVSYLFDDGTIKNTPNFDYQFNTNSAKTVSIMQFAVNAYGCRDSIIKQVEIKPAFVIYIPNAFTPNGDGLNDGFQAKGMGIVDFKLQIFDRWGALVFETSDINKAWDGSVNGNGGGEDSKQEVYVWKASVVDVLREKHSLIGHVTLLK